MKCKGNCFTKTYRCSKLITQYGYFCTLFQNQIKNMINCQYKQNQRNTFKKKHRRKQYEINTI